MSTSTQVRLTHNENNLVPLRLRGYVLDMQKNDSIIFHYIKTTLINM